MRAFKYISIFVLTIASLFKLVASSKPSESQDNFHKERGLLYHGEQLFTGSHETKFKSGNRKSIIEYANGKKHGRFITWHENGQISEKRFYQDNRKHGLHHCWFPDGNPRAELNFDNGIYHGKCQQWFSNGQKFAETNFEYGEETGSQKAWNELGNLKANYVVKDGHRYGLIGSKLCVSTIEKQ